MACLLRTGHRTWSGDIEEDGHRTYEVMWLVETDTTDGPANVMQTPGLPLVGTPWIISADVDIYAWCRPGMKVKIHDEREGEAATIWSVTQKFSTRPPAANARQGCGDIRIEDPLFEPQQVSGGFTKYTEEAKYDRFGTPILNSAWEQVTGPLVEFDANRPTVKIVQNVPSLQLELFAPMIDCVNSVPMWGLGTRRVKLSTVSWEKKYYGACQVYYTRTLDFDINYNTFDRSILDQGTKVLNGHWGRGSTGGTGEGSGWVLDLLWNPETMDLEFPDPLNPSHFIRATDRNGNPISLILNGAGEPYDPVGSTVGTHDDTAGRLYIEKYNEANFFLLGIPAVL